MTGLQPSDFVVSEDGIAQNIATFEEGNEGPQNVAGAALHDPRCPKSPAGFAQPIAKMVRARRHPIGIPWRGSRPR